MALAWDVNRLVPSLAMFVSFFLLGVFVSALGPAVPSLSRYVDTEEVSFGLVFCLRGLGHLLGSWSSALRFRPTELKAGLRKALNDRMNRMGAATTGLGLFSIALVAARAFWLVCVWCFCQGFCGGAIDTIANAAISDVHSAGAAPWMQGLHFCFSVGALMAPAAVSQFGYREVFIAFGVLAMPASLACYGADTGGDDSSSGSGSGGGSGSGWPLRGDGKGVVVREESYGTTYSTDSMASCESDAEMMEAAARRSSDDSLPPNDGKLVQLEGAPSILTAEKSTAHEQRSQRESSVGAAKQSAAATKSSAAAAAAAAAATIGVDSQAQQLGASVAAAHKLSSASRPTVPKKTAHDVVAGQQQSRQGDQTALLPRKGGGGDLPPFTLIALLSFFLFLYVGAEVGFGAWVAVVVLRDGLAGEAGAVRMASLFWGGITVGRLLAVPLAVRFSNAFLVRANLLGGLLSSLLLLLAGRVSYAWAALGVGLFGLSMASTFPLAISLLPCNGFFLSGKNSSRMVIGGALGDMLMPALIAALMGPDDGVWPAALYVVCVVISVAMLFVYGACCGLLNAAGQRVGQGEARL